jgi:hypothetical protein
LLGFGLTKLRTELSLVNHPAGQHPPTLIAQTITLFQRIGIYIFASAASATVWITGFPQMTMEHCFPSTLPIPAVAAKTVSGTTQRRLSHIATLPTKTIRAPDLVSEKDEDELDLVSSESEETSDTDIGEEWANHFSDHDFEPF